MAETLPRWNAAEIDFIDVASDDVKNRIISNLETAIGRTLEEGDPLYLVGLTFANEIINLRSAINISAQQQVLAYAQGEYLDAYGIAFDCSRLQATPAVCDLKFTLSTPQESVYTIPKGTQVSNGSNESIFETDSDLIFEIGETEGTVSASSINVGTFDNGLSINSLNVMVNPLPYIQSVVNTTKTAGGADIESDARYAERLHNITNRITTAGPVASYQFHAMSVSSAISDVQIFTPSPGIVRVYILLENGQLPTTTICDKVKEYLSAEDIRPLGDFVEVLPPEVISTEIRGRYFVDRASQSQGTAIQNSVSAAVEDFIQWQTSKIGRDINRDEFIKRVISAGAKRVELELPNHSILANFQIAQISNVNFVFAGYEEE